MSLWMTTTFFAKNTSMTVTAFFCMILLVNLAAAAVVLGEVTVWVLPNAIAAVYVHSN